MLNILKQGALRRHTGATLMNKESSRSHSVLSTTIETKVMKNGLFNIKISKFHIIDLAGSERAKNTEAVGSRLKEAGMINKSLSTLGNVINSLVDVSLGKSRHVHYRDSKLTFLLRDSLGGNSKTLIIANVSPASVSFGETLSTLKFAQRAKLIKNKAIINEDSSGTVAILKDEIKRLKLAMTKMKLNLISKNKQICSKCSEKVEKRNSQNINEGSIATDYNPEDLSLCKSDSVNENITSTGTKNWKQLESMLKKNCTQTIQLQAFYDNQINEKDQLIKRLRCANENYERQQTRDNMIIKFRDSTISRFGNLSYKIQDEECAKEFENYKQEILILQNQLSENPKLVRANVEIEELKHEISKFKKESDNIEDSYLTLYKSSLEFIDELKEYLDFNEEERQIFNNNVIQEYIKKIDAFKLEIERAESQSEGYKELLSSTQAEYEIKMQEIESELHRTKQEIREIREKEITELRDKLIREEQEKYQIHANYQTLNIEKQTLDEETKHLIEERETLHNEKSYLQNEKNTLQHEKTNLLYEKNNLQHEKTSLIYEKNTLENEKNNLISEKHSLISEKESLQIEKLNIEKLFEQMKAQYLEKEDDYKGLICSLKTELSDFKQKVDCMKNTIDLQNNKISFLEEIKIVKEQLEKDKKVLQDEVFTLGIDLRKQEHEGNAKSEEMSNLKSKLTELGSEIMNLREEFDTKTCQYNYEISKKNTKINDLTMENENAKNEIKKFQKEIENEKDRTETLKKQYDDENNKSMRTVNKLIDEKRELDDEKSDLLDTINNLQSSVNDLSEQIKDLEDNREHIEIEIEMKNSHIRELEDEILEKTKEKDEFKDKYIDMLNRAEDDERKLEEKSKLLHSLKSDIATKIGEIEKLNKDKIELTVSLKEYKSQEIYYTRFSEEAEKYKNEVVRLKENLNDERREKEALQEIVDKENEKEGEVEFDVIKQHPAFIRLVHALKQCKKQADEFKSENEGLKEQMDKMNVVNGLEAEMHINPSQKIKHFQKIKDENNFLKKELVSMYNENRKLKQSKGEDDSKSKSIKVMEIQCRKMKMKLDAVK